MSGRTNPFKPYAGRLARHDRLPGKGRDREDVLDELATIAAEEDRIWRGGKVSGTYYHAGEEHRELLGRAFSLFSHVNVLQIDTCPVMSKLEAEIVAMTARMLHSDAARDRDPKDDV